MSMLRTARLTAAVLAVFTTTAPAAQTAQRGFPHQSQNPHIEKYAYILRSAVWTEPVVYVCWENPGAAPEAEREWVRQAVAETWQQASALEFKGWGACAAKVEGIRIRIEDSGPHVKALGRGLDGLADGMVLNFAFNAWSPICKSSESQRKLCIRSIAVHEFGHAVGFAHEQNRPDAPGECAVLAQGSDGDEMLTPYDLDSCMNYCNPVYNNDGELSDLDREAVIELYGPADDRPEALN